ncbi:MAG: hypothetical protein AAF514_13610 [Verrucomicrobiota bacterium]
MNKTELLVVVVFFVPVFAFLLHWKQPVNSARWLPGFINSKKVATALKLYADDHDGVYPQGKTSSNEALAQLFPEYIDEEKIFHIPKSLFCRPDPPDEEIGQNEGGSGSALEAGENHFAYVSGYKNTDRSTYPLLADGFTAEGNTYDEQHIWWKVDKAVVVYLDGSVKPEIIKKTGERGEVRGKKSKQNLFKAGTLGPGVILNPLRKNAL